MVESGEVNFVSCCPIVDCPNKRNTVSFQWVHAECWGNMKVVGTGHLRCSRCNLKGEILDWLFQCEYHDYQELSAQGFLFAMSVAAQLQGISPSWFMKLNVAILDQARHRGV